MSSDYYILDYQQDEQEQIDPTDWEYAMCRQEQMEQDDKDIPYEPFFKGE